MTTFQGQKPLGKHHYDLLNDVVIRSESWLKGTHWILGIWNVRTLNRDGESRELVALLDGDVCGQILRREELRIVGKRLRIRMNGRRPLRGEIHLGQ